MIKLPRRPKLSGYVTKALRDLRKLYDQFYYLSKDLSRGQKRKLRRKLWKIVKLEIKQEEKHYRAEKKGSIL